MKLEVGKTYRDVHGNVHTITRRDGRWYCAEIPALGYLKWDSNGKPREVVAGVISYPLVAEVGVTEYISPGPVTDCIPHADLIRAALDGKTIQRWFTNSQRWGDYRGQHAIRILADTLCRNAHFRIKPTSVVLWFPVVKDTPPSPSVVIGICRKEKEQLPLQLGAGPVVKHLRLEMDPDTLEVLSAKTETP